STRRGHREDRDREQRESESGRAATDTTMPLPKLFRSPAKNPAVNEALERSQSNRAALSAAINNAVTASIACQLANTARSYAKGQRLWNEFCAERQFDDGVLVSEEKLVLSLQDVVLQ